MIISATIKNALSCYRAHIEELKISLNSEKCISLIH